MFKKPDYSTKTDAQIVSEVEFQCISLYYRSPYTRDWEGLHFKARPWWLRDRERLQCLLRSYYSGLQPERVDGLVEKIVAKWEPLFEGDYPTKGISEGFSFGAHRGMDLRDMSEERCIPYSYMEWVGCEAWSEADRLRAHIAMWWRDYVWDGEE